MALKLVLTAVLGFYALMLAKINPWRARTSRDRVSHPIAVGAWWLWVLSLLVGVALVWSAPFRAWLDHVINNVVVGPAGR